MPKKKSVKKSAHRFCSVLGDVRDFLAEVFPGQTKQHVSWLHDLAIIRTYSAFEELMLEALVGAINNDTSTISDRTGFEFPSHLTDEVCEYLITGGRYFDFKGRDGLISELKRNVPNDHYLVTIVKKPKYRTTLTRLSALRNLAAHNSTVAKRAARKAVEQERMGTAGSWLKSRGRFDRLCDRLLELAKEIEENAPY